MTADPRYPSPRALLAKYGLRAKKSWGQNFLGDQGILDHIAQLAAPRPGDLVVELGAGLGHLTARLVARGARVVAVERDRDMAKVLRGELGERIALLEADAVRLDYGAILRERAAGPLTPALSPGSAGGEGDPAHPTSTATAFEREAVHPERPSTSPPLRGGYAQDERAMDEAARSRRAAPPTATATPRIAVVGNLPYHLTSPILFSLLDQAPRIARAVFLVQREVAERLAAAPGTHAWGILSVLLQREADVSIERIVPRGAFLPPPNVDSAVLCALFRPAADEVRDPVRFRRLVKGGFAQRRKTLGNALRAARIASPEQLAAALERAQVDPGRRGETLTVAEWAALERALGDLQLSRAPAR